MTCKMDAVILVKAVIFVSLLAFGTGSVLDCNEDNLLLSKNSYDYVVESYGRNNSLSANGLLLFFTNLSLFESTSNVMKCSVLNSLASLDNSDLLIDSANFSNICSNILTFLDKNGYHFSANNNENKFVKSMSDKPTESAVWGFGMLAVTIISLCSLVGISILPLMKTDSYDVILLYLIALAVGTLSSNAIFQLIPEGFGIDTKPNTVWQSAVIFGGFYLFYLVENILERIFNTSHNHADPEFISEADNNLAVKIEKGNGIPIQHNCNEAQSNECKEALLHLPADSGVMTASESEQSSEHFGTLRPAAVVAAKQKQCSIFKNYRSIKTVAWMITVADGIHNFIDGLAIGASFSTSLVQGLSTSLAIFCEEFPHELGDFAILISAGMTIRQAAFYNFASACCCYLGLFVGILVGSDFSSAQWIFALAGGVFLYISLAGMLPEAQAHCTKKSLKHKPWLCMFIKNAGLLTGFFIMLFLTLYKDKITV